jgi:hypothetical protein
MVLIGALVAGFLLMLALLVDTAAVAVPRNVSEALVHQSGEQAPAHVPLQVLVVWTHKQRLEKLETHTQLA